jgi:hypothetical protein
MHPAKVARGDCGRSYLWEREIIDLWLIGPLNGGDFWPGTWNRSMGGEVFTSLHSSHDWKLFLSYSMTSDGSRVSLERCECAYFWSMMEWLTSDHPIPWGSGYGHNMFSFPFLMEMRFLLSNTIFGQSTKTVSLQQVINKLNGHKHPGGTETTFFLIVKFIECKLLPELD